MTFPPAPGAPLAGDAVRRPRGLVVAGAVVIGVGLLGVLGCLIGIFSGLGSSLTQSLTAPVLQIPTDQSMALQKGDYTIFQLTGHQSGTVGSRVVENSSPTLTASQVTVTGPDSRAVPVVAPFLHTETETRGEDLYTGAVQFTTTVAGTYRITITPDSAGQVIVAPSLTAGFVSAGEWALGAVGGGFVFLVGVVLLIVGLVRRNSSRAPAAGFVPGAVGASGPGGPLPGWYPDQMAPGRFRYWDGRQWTEHSR
jgi:Protein of unknown function (DUF2510)